MIVRLTLKDPVYELITDSVRDSLPEGLSDAEREAVEEVRREEVSAACGRWVEYGEYVTIEIDTKAGTATVVPK